MAKKITLAVNQFKRFFTKSNFSDMSIGVIYTGVKIKLWPPYNEN